MAYQPIKTATSFQPTRSVLCDFVSQGGDSLAAMKLAERNQNHVIRENHPEDL